jgi:hypothetical protein
MTFRPHLTPIEMIQMGVFGGSYFARATEQDFEGMHPDLEVLCRTQTGRYDKRKNAFGVKSGDSYEEWLKRGHIFPEDPLGWFHWYCRWHSGRRHPRDEHQMGRWARFEQRWGQHLRIQVEVHGDGSPKVKQSLLHWAILPAKVLFG